MQQLTMNKGVSSPLLQPAGTAPRPGPGDARAAASGEGFSSVLAHELPRARSARQSGEGSAPAHAHPPESTDDEQSTVDPSHAVLAPASVPEEDALVESGAPEAVTDEETDEVRTQAGDGALQTLPGAASTEAMVSGDAVKNPSTATVPAPANPPAEGAPEHQGLPEGEAVAEAGKGPVGGGQSLPQGGKDAPRPVLGIDDTLSHPSIKTEAGASNASLPAGRTDTLPLPGLNALAEAMAGATEGGAPRVPAPPVSAGEPLRGLTQGVNPPQFVLQVPAGGEEWNGALGNRIRWMAGLKISSAELQLHPAELGALEVRIRTEDDRTTVSFTASNAAARELIEASLPRLRELLAGSGLQLDHGEVSQQAARDDASPFGRAPRLGAEPAETMEDPAPFSAPRAGAGLIDHYV